MWWGYLKRKSPVTYPCKTITNIHPPHWVHYPWQITLYPEKIIYFTERRHIVDRWAMTHSQIYFLFLTELKQLTAFFLLFWCDVYQHCETWSQELWLIVQLFHNVHLVYHSALGELETVIFQLVHMISQLHVQESRPWLSQITAAFFHFYWSLAAGLECKIVSPHSKLSQLKLFLVQVDKNLVMRGINNANTGLYCIDGISYCKTLYWMCQ